MAQDLDNIERNIEVARDNLSATLDELADRVSPSNLIARGKEAALDALGQTSVQIGLGVAAATIIGITITIAVLKK